MELSHDTMDYYYGRKEYPKESIDGVKLKTGYIFKHFIYSKKILYVLVKNPLVPLVENDYKESALVKSENWFSWPPVYSPFEIEKIITEIDEMRKVLERNTGLIFYLEVIEVDFMKEMLE